MRNKRQGLKRTHFCLQIYKTGTEFAISAEGRKPEQTLTGKYLKCRLKKSNLDCVLVKQIGFSSLGATFRNKLNFQRQFSTTGGWLQFCRVVLARTQYYDFALEMVNVISGFFVRQD